MHNNNLIVQRNQKLNYPIKYLALTNNYYINRACLYQIKLLCTSISVLNAGFEFISLSYNSYTNLTEQYNSKY